MIFGKAARTVWALVKLASPTTGCARLQFASELLWSGEGFKNTYLIPPSLFASGSQVQLTLRREGFIYYFYSLEILPLKLVANRNAFFFIRTFCADRKYQRTLRIGRFFNAKRSWWFLGGAELTRLSAQARITNVQTVLATFPKIIDAVWLKT